MVYFNDEVMKMETFTKVKGIYKDGVIKPLSKLKLPNNMYVIVLLSKEERCNFNKVDKAAKKTFGTIPGLPSGVGYIKKLRTESEARVKELLHE